MKENDDIRDILDQQDKEKDVYIAPIRLTWQRIYLILFFVILYLILRYLGVL